MDFFKPEDCDLVISHSAFGGIYEPKCRYTPLGPNTQDVTNCLSLEKANRILHKRGLVVYGNTQRMWDERQFKYDTHKAILINIEPLEKEDDADEMVIIP